MRLLPVRYHRPYTVVLALFVLSHYCGCLWSHRGKLCSCARVLQLRSPQFITLQLIVGNRNDPPQTRNDDSQDDIG